MTTVKLHLGDCMNVLPTLETGSIDAVITDPPYSTSDQWTINPTSRKSDDLRMQHDWQDILGWVPEIARLLTRKGQWYIFTNDDCLSFLIDAARGCGLEPLRRLVWIKTNPRPSIPRRIFRKSGEIAMWGTTGGAPSYFGAENQQDALAFDMLPICSGKERTKHPTQKPLALISRYVRIGCPEGGTVLDPFMGSGTTGVACAQIGRDFIGIEIDPDYFAIAEKRIREAISQPQLPGMNVNQPVSQLPLEATQ